MLKKKPAAVKKAAPKAPASDVNLSQADPEAEVIAEAPQDHHNIPDRDYSVYRPHDEARGCWCFPEIEGNEVNHR